MDKVLGSFEVLLDNKPFLSSGALRIRDEGHDFCTGGEHTIVHSYPVPSANTRHVATPNRENFIWTQKAAKHITKLMENLSQIRKN